MNFYSFQIQESYKNNNFSFSTNYIYNSCINCASNEEQMKSFANASKIDLNSICDVCTDVKNTHTIEKGPDFKRIIIWCSTTTEEGERCYLLKRRNNTVLAIPKFNDFFGRKISVALNSGHTRI